jgi:hypothetical protein
MGLAFATVLAFVMSLMCSCAPMGLRAARGEGLLVITIRDPANRPADYITVYAAAASGHVDSTKTDDFGRAKLVLPPGRVLVTAADKDWLRHRRHRGAFVGGLSTVDTVTIVPGRTTTLRRTMSQTEPPAIYR